MSDFIDRAKLEALANERSPHLSGVSKFLAVETFMAGAAAFATLLDAETTEEWGVRSTRADGTRVSQPVDSESTARTAADYYNMPVVSRRVTPWLPSEGGEKP